MDGLTAELENLRHRKSQLDALLVAAEQRLDEATRDRQAKLLEYDPANDGPPTNAIILRLTDERDACIDALAAVDAKATAAQHRLDEERDSLQRQTASKELTAAADQLDRVAVDLAAVTSRLPEAMQQVLTRLPTKPVSKEHVELFATEVVAALQLIAREGRLHAVQVACGAGTVCEPAAQEPAKPPAPKVERLEIFPLQPSKMVGS
jgi:hypothetical protein